METGTRRTGILGLLFRRPVASERGVLWKASDFILCTESQVQQEVHPRVAQIIATLHVRYNALNLHDKNLHYEAGWTESWSHRSCLHEHQTLIDAARCAMPHGCGWYVFAVRYGMPRELTEGENRIVDEFRFGRTGFM